MRILLLILILSINARAQKLPITGLKLSEVVAVTGGSSLSAAFTNSIDGYFDVTYKGSKDRLGNFRNYGPPSCAELATISTVSMVYSSSGVAQAEVNMSSMGSGCTVTEMGMCYGTSANPTISGSHTATATVATGPYSFGITGLTDGTTYHYRAYATNSYGTTYGADQTYTQSPSCGRESSLPDSKFFNVYNGVAITSSNWCDSYTYQGGTCTYVEAEVQDAGGGVFYAWLGWGSSACSFVPNGYYLFEFYGTLLRYQVTDGILTVYDCPQ